MYLESQSYIRFSARAGIEAVSVSSLGSASLAQEKLYWEVISVKRTLLVLLLFATSARN